MNHIPFELINESLTDSGILLICDHASKDLPPLEFDPRAKDFIADKAELQRHIGIDIGAASVTKHLAKSLSAPAILAKYSRLYIDLNRHYSDFTSMRSISDGTVINGNCNLTLQEKQKRIDAIFDPYHKKIESLRAEMAKRSNLRIIFVHSFTPHYKGCQRPWHLGILSGVGHKAFAHAFLGKWQELYDFPIGDNEPYSGEDSYSYSIHEHAEKHAHLHFGLEIRQDLIDTDKKALDWSERIATCILQCL